MKIIEVLLIPLGKFFMDKLSSWAAQLFGLQCLVQGDVARNQGGTPGVRRRPPYLLIHDHS